jgi:hypothetical protein
MFASSLPILTASDAPSLNSQLCTYMKHPEELKTKFIELRARGVSYGRISEELGVSKPTLMQWGRAMAEEIADLQAAEREIVREKLLGNFEQWLGRQVHHFNRLDAEFGRRELKYSPTESVFRMMMTSRKVLERYFFEGDRPARRGVRTSSSAATDVSPASADSKRDEMVQPPAPEPSRNHNRNLNPPEARAVTNFPSPSGRGIEGEGQTSALGFLRAAAPDSEGRVPSSPQGETVQPVQSDAASSNAEPHNSNGDSPPGFQIAKPKSEIENPSTPTGDGARTEMPSPDIARPEGPSAEAQNPAKTLPFTSPQRQGSPLSHDEPFIESTVVSPIECLRSVLEKCLEAEASCRSALDCVSV